ncbi:MAG: hypothetical protein Q9166_006680 [cf. Caloplaca sp. 2 TL-2023]
MYHALARIEKQLAVIELDCLRKTYIATRPKFLERATAIKAVPDFWSTVIDEAPAEIDQRIQPRDVPALNCLTGVDVERFEVLDADHGEPRSLKLTFTFTPNEWFFDEKIEKKFYWRMTKSGWSGLVSEPVYIHWKDRDLTDGLLGLAFNLYKKEADFKSNGQEADEINATREYKTLVQEVQSTPQDAISFFGLFGFRGHHVSAKEFIEAGREQSMVKSPRQSEALDEESPPLPDTEIFPHGEEVAIALSEDLYPGATHYFSTLSIYRARQLVDKLAATAKERDAKISDEELVSDTDDSEGSSNVDGDEHERSPNKKMKISA